MAATDPITPVPRRFSIRLPRPIWIALPTIALVVMAVAVQVGAPVYRQQEALREIARVGGNVVMHTGRPQWLRDMVGDERMELFDQVTGVYLHDTQACDATLDHVRGLKSVQNLSLDNTNVTDKGLQHLTGLTKLRWLRLVNTQVTDAGIADLKRSLPDAQIVR